MKLPIPLLAVFVSLPAVAADSATPSNATHAALVEQGKKIFVTRRAKCHDNDANKKLPDGTTLLGRLAKLQDPEVRLGTRLKDPQERHAVMVYVDSLLKNLQSSSQQQPLRQASKNDDDQTFRRSSLISQFASRLSQRGIAATKHCRELSAVSSWQSALAVAQTRSL